jgi:hypothetical protein
MDSIRLTRKVNSPGDKVRSLFWNVATWSNIWDTITKIRLLYDDGIYQEFTMDLSWRERPASIRVISMRDHDGGIEFFSPIPPAEMEWHTGRWGFIGLGHSCEVMALREYRLRRIAGEGEEDYRARRERFEKEFRGRLEQLLAKMGDYLEASVD